MVLSQVWIRLQQPHIEFFRGNASDARKFVQEQTAYQGHRFGAILDGSNEAYTHVDNGRISLHVPAGFGFFLQVVQQRQIEGFLTRQLLETPSIDQHINRFQQRKHNSRFVLVLFEKPEES